MTFAATVDYDVKTTLLNESEFAVSVVYVSGGVRKTISMVLTDPFAGVQEPDDGGKVMVTERRGRISIDATVGIPTIKDRGDYVEIGGTVWQIVSHVDRLKMHEIQLRQTKPIRKTIPGFLESGP